MQETASSYEAMSTGLPPCSSLAMAAISWRPPTITGLPSQDHFVGNDPPSFDPRDESRVLSVFTSDGGNSWTGAVVPPDEDAFYGVDAVP